MPSETSSEPKLTLLTNNASVKKSHQRKSTSAEMMVRTVPAGVSTSTLERPMILEKNSHLRRSTSLETSR